MFFILIKYVLVQPNINFTTRTTHKRYNIYFFIKTTNLDEHNLHSWYIVFTYVPKSNMCLQTIFVKKRKSVPVAYLHFISLAFVPRVRHRLSTLQLQSISRSLPWLPGLACAFGPLRDQCSYPAEFYS